MFHVSQAAQSPEQLVAYRLIPQRLPEKEMFYSEL